MHHPNFRYGTGYDAVQLDEEKGDLGLNAAFPEISPIDTGNYPPSNWHAIAHIKPKTITKRFDRINGLAAVVFEVLGEVPCPVFVRGIPNSESSMSIANKIKSPISLNQFAEAVGEATKEGYPPYAYQAYLAAPKPEKILNLVDVVYEELKKKGDVKTLITNLQSVLKRDRPVIAMMVEKGIVPHTPDKLRTTRGYTEFGFSRRGENVIGLVATVVDRSIIANAPLSKEAIDGITTDSKLTAFKRKDITDAITGVYYHSLWDNFTRYVEKHQAGINAALTAVLKTQDVRAAYDAAKGHAPPVSGPERENVSRQSGPNPVLYPHLKTIKREARGPLVTVAGSIRSTDADDGAVMISTNEDDRRWQRADGSYTRPDPIPAQAGAWIPAARVKPLIDTPEYDVYFGVYYDHPLLSPKTSAQTYWYGSKNLFIRAGTQYGLMTGDSPFVAVRIISKIPPKKNIAISYNELKNDQSAYGEAGEAVLRQIKQILTSYKNANAEGKQQWLPKVHEMLGNEIDTTLRDKIPENPKKRKPDNVDQDKWNAYVKWIRTKGERVLGLRLSAARQFGSTSHFSFTKDRKLVKVNTAHARNLAFRREHAGERGPDGKVVERPSLYLVEYLVGYRRYGSRLGSYIIPINVIRSDVDLDPRQTATKITDGELRGFMHEKFTRFPISTKSDWKFIRGGAYFPVPRLQRISVATEEEQKEFNDAAQRKGVNNISRTTFGYKVDNIEWDAHQMVFVMAPSVAEEKYGFLPKGGYARLLINDPDILNRIRRTTTFKGQGTTTPELKHSLQTLGIYPKPMHTENPFIGEPGKEKSTSWFQSQDQSEVDPYDVEATPIPFGFMLSKIGERLEPKIKPRLDNMENVVDVFVDGFQQANSFTEQKKHWLEFERKGAQMAGQAEAEIMRHLATESQQVMAMGKASNRGRDLYENLRTYIRYVKMAVGPNGHTVTVPQIVTKTGMATYHGIIGSLDTRNEAMTIKAPSEDLARYMLMLRLLRRSVRNPDMGRAMGLRSQGDAPVKYLLLKNQHMKLLAQWKAMGYKTIKDEDVRGVRYIGPRKYPTKYDYEFAEPYTGVHRHARVLRTD